MDGRRGAKNKHSISSKNNVANNQSARHNTTNSSQSSNESSCQNLENVDTNSSAAVSSQENHSAVNDLAANIIHDSTANINASVSTTNSILDPPSQNVQTGPPLNLILSSASASNYPNVYNLNPAVTSADSSSQSSSGSGDILANSRVRIRQRDSYYNNGNIDPVGEEEGLFATAKKPAANELFEQATKGGGLKSSKQQKHHPASDIPVSKNNPSTSSCSTSSNNNNNGVLVSSNQLKSQLFLNQQQLQPNHKQQHYEVLLQQQQQFQQQQLAQNAGDHQPTYNWQATRTSLKSRLSYIYNSELMADVHFLVGKAGHTQQRIPAHKFVLSIGSAVFDAMFNGGMATQSAEVELPDVEPSAFLSLLQFLYSDEVVIGPETVMTTLYTAKKYAVPALEAACVDFLKRNLGSDNAFMLLTQARLFDEPQLASLCLETIDKNTADAFAADSFTDVDLDTLSVVLERDTLGIRECKLFTAVCRWASAECTRQNIRNTPENQRSVLGQALRLVRFPLMSVEEFAQGAAQTALLTDRELVELFLYFTVNPKPPVSFTDVPRCCMSGKEQVVSRFSQVESRWGYSGTSDRIKFMVNRRIFVVGFGLYGSIHSPSEYAVKIQIIDTDSGNICGTNDASFQCDGSTSTFRLMFKEPIEILLNTSYTACATLKGADSYYGTKGMRKVTHESASSGKVNFTFTYAAGNNNGTSVEDGQIPEIIFYT